MASRLSGPDTAAMPAQSRAKAKASGPKTDPETVDQHGTEFERKRAARIAENQARLKELQLQDLAVEAFKPRRNTQAPGTGQPQQRQSSKRAAAPAAASIPTRKSARVLNKDGAGSSLTTPAGLLEDDPARQLLTQEEYLASQGLSVPVDAIRTTSHFRGWVEEGMRQRYGLAGSAAEAWEEGGGGSFSYKINKSELPKGSKRSGWSDAKAHAHTQLKKNPNVYFFRHVAPHMQQAKGPFSEAEHQLFLETARQWGCGDKWGLFASYIGTRVGYQCRCYYQQFLIPQGLILDPQFKLTASGEAVWVGRSDEEAQGGHGADQE